MSRRIGKFYVTGNLVRGIADDLMIELQTGLAVVHIENEVFKDRILMYAIGEMFEPVPSGQKIPLYMVNKTSTEDGDVIINFVKEQ